MHRTGPIKEKPSLFLNEPHLPRNVYDLILPSRFPRKLPDYGEGFHGPFFEYELVPTVAEDLTIKTRNEYGPHIAGNA